MPVVDFPQLFIQADNLRNDAKVDEAIQAYRQIAELASEPEELPWRARAFHMAGVSAKESVVEEGTYYRDAVAFFDQAETFYRQLNQPEEIGALYRDQAILADNAGKTNLAASWFQKSLTELSQVDAPSQLGSSYEKFGLHYFKNKDYPTAERYIRQGLAILEKEPSAGFFHATALYDLARVSYKLSKLTEAKDLALVSRSWFEADHGLHNYQRRLAQLEGLLSVIYFELNDTKRARQSAQRYQSLLKTFDPLAVQVIEKDLREVVN